MLSECSSRLNQMGVGNNKIDPRSPYLIQFKIFEDRMKKQYSQIRSHSHGNALKERAKSNNIKEDYLNIVKNLLERNENANIFEDVPYQATEPSIDSTSEVTIEKIKRKLDDRRTAKTEKCRRPKPMREMDCYSQATENLLFESRSRIHSEINTNFCKKKAFNVKDKGLTFIRYKKDKRVLESGCKNIRGLL